jgi:hypothetical protein
VPYKVTSILRKPERTIVTEEENRLGITIHPIFDFSPAQSPDILTLVAGNTPDCVLPFRVHSG